MTWWSYKISLSRFEIGVILATTTLIAYRLGIVPFEPAKKHDCINRLLTLYWKGSQTLCRSRFVGRRTWRQAGAVTSCRIKLDHVEARFWRWRLKTARSIEVVP